MAKRQGGATVKSGFYWNLAKWEMKVVPKQGGVLPGGPAETYLKVPVAGLLVMAPVMGAVYAVFLPFIGFALVLGFVGRKAIAGAKALTGHVMATVSPQWSPGTAYLAGKGDAKESKGGDGSPGAPGDAGSTLGAVEREIDEQRKLNG